jgi:Cu/Ag efflux protein CusF
MRSVVQTVVFAFATTALLSAQTGSSTVHGTVKKIDAASKTVVVTTDKGAEEAIAFTDKTVVHGAAAGGQATLHGLKEGSEVVAHCTTTGGKKTAVEMDNLGKDGLKVAEGSISKVGAGGKTVVVKLADGTEQTFETTGHAAAEIGAATASGADKAAKVSVHYTEEGGKKVAHFFKKA